MDLLTAAEQKRFSLQTHAIDGDELRGANEYDTDQEDTQLALSSVKANRLGDDVEGGPHKRRKLQELAILKMIDHCARICVRIPVPTKLRSTNVQARTKMKARGLFIDDDDSTEVSVAASQERLTSAEWAELEAEIAGMEEEGLSEWKPSAVLEEDMSKKAKEKKQTPRWRPRIGNQSLRLALLCTCLRRGEIFIS